MPVPPDTVVVIDPLFPPKQVTLACVPETERIAGCVIFQLAVLLQLLSSVTVTVYIPVVREDIEAVVNRLLHT